MEYTVQYKITGFCKTTAESEDQAEINMTKKDFGPLKDANIELVDFGYEKGLSKYIYKVESCMDITVDAKSKNEASKKAAGIFKDIDFGELEGIEGLEGIEDKTFNNGYDYDIAVYQTDHGLSKASYMELLNMVSGDNVLPIDLEADSVEAFAIGFISTEAADALNYDYDGLQTYLSMIMGDISKENDNCEYSYNGLSVYMGYERFRNLENDRETERDM